jgi:hypothetical protein
VLNDLLSFQLSVECGCRRQLKTDDRQLTTENEKGHTLDTQHIDILFHLDDTRSGDIEVYARLCHAADAHPCRGADE